MCIKWPQVFIVANYCTLKHGYYREFQLYFKLRRIPNNIKMWESVIPHMNSKLMTIHTSEIFRHFFAAQKPKIFSQYTWQERSFRPVNPLLQLLPILASSHIKPVVTMSSEPRACMKRQILQLYTMLLSCTRRTSVCIFTLLTLMSWYWHWPKYKTWVIIQWSLWGVARIVSGSLFFQYITHLEMKECMHWWGSMHSVDVKSLGVFWGKANYHGGQFLEADGEVIRSLSHLGIGDKPTPDVLSHCERFICNLLSTTATVHNDSGALRWAQCTSTYIEHICSATFGNRCTLPAPSSLMPQLLVGLVILMANLSHFWQDCPLLQSKLLNLFNVVAPRACVKGTAHVENTAFSALNYVDVVQILICVETWRL